MREEEGKYDNGIKLVMNRFENTILPIEVEVDHDLTVCEDKEIRAVITVKLFYGGSREEGSGYNIGQSANTPGGRKGFWHKAGNAYGFTGWKLIKRHACYCNIRSESTVKHFEEWRHIVGGKNKPGKSDAEPECDENNELVDMAEMARSEYMRMAILNGAIHPGDNHIVKIFDQRDEMTQEERDLWTHVVKMVSSAVRASDESKK